MTGGARHVALEDKWVVRAGLQDPLFKTNIYLNECQTPKQPHTRLREGVRSPEITFAKRWFRHTPYLATFSKWIFQLTSYRAPQLVNVNMCSVGHTSIW